MRNLLVAQSGGPTAAINATVAGVVSCAVLSGKVDHIYGAVNGIEGVLAEKFLDLGKKLDSAEKISLLMQTPAAALGSCRYKLGDPEENKEDFEEILQIFRRHEIRYFIYIGGNDSMDTVDKMSKYCKENGVDDVFVVGAPKTIDNDLVETDHCPGFASAAKYIATSCAEVWQDAHVYDTGMITIIEIMGRHAGWLAASAALASEYGAGPDLIYLPETDFSMPKFIEDVKRVYAEKGSCIIAVSEGIHYEDGGFVSEAKVATNDGFGHAQLGGLAAILAQVLKEETGAEPETFLPLGKIIPAPGCYGEVLHLFLAKGLKFSEQHLDPDEFLNVERVPFDEMVHRCMNGEIDDAKTVAAVLRAKVLLNL